jgi:hypothetical protein
MAWIRLFFPFNIHHANVLDIPVIRREPVYTSSSDSQCTYTSESAICEDISSQECDSLDGCYVDWGPCEATFNGFYSPAGTLSQRPCPSVQSDIKWIYGSSEEPCRPTCIDPRKILRDESCTWIPAGRYSQKCSGNSLETLGTCAAYDGIIFIQFNSCLAERVAALLGERFIADSEKISIQTWVSINTKSLSVGGQGSHTLLLGAFGEFFLGLRYEEEDNCTLYAGYRDLISESRPVPHLYGTWNHIAVTIDNESGGVNFFLNGFRIHTNDTTRIPESVITDSLFSEVVAAQYIAYLYRMHFGPFFIAADRLVPGVVSILSHYTGQVSIPMQLYQINITDSISLWSELDCFSNSPAGREPIRPVCDGHWCHIDPGVCYPECGSNLIFDYYSCECLKITTVTTDSTDPCNKYAYTLLSTKNDTQRETSNPATEVAQVTTKSSMLTTIRKSESTDSIKGTGFFTIPEDCLVSTSTPNVTESVPSGSSISGEEIFAVALGVIMPCCVLYLWVKRRRKNQRIENIISFSPTPIANQWETQLSQYWSDLN